MSHDHTDWEYITPKLLHKVILFVLGLIGIKAATFKCGTCDKVVIITDSSRIYGA